METEVSRTRKGSLGATIRRDGPELGRFLVNGVAATVVTWVVMRLFLDVLDLPWAWLAFWIGAIAGITVSFLGNRYFVFRRADAPMAHQAARFVAAYAVIALMVSGIMALWADVFHLDPNSGFVLATGVQVTLSFVANRVLVFA